MTEQINQQNALASITTPAGAVMQLAVPEATISALDDLTEQGVIAGNVSSQFKRIFVTGAVMYNMKQILTPAVMQHIMFLQNSPIGFLTDRPQGYGVDEVRNCIIEASIRGLNIVGNEFNILAGRFYATKNGMKHMLKNIQGLKQNVTPGIPKMTGENSATVEMHLDWTYGGKRQEKAITFAIRVNKGMGADAVIGKATRKAYAWLYEEVTGNSASDGEVGDTVPLVPSELPKVVESPIEASPVKEEPTVLQNEDTPFELNM